MKTKNILVLGLGIEILTDDGIGSILTKIMSEKFKSFSITFKTNHVGGFDLLEIIDGYKTVVFIDAVKSNHDLPGKLVLYNLDNYSETSHLSNIHDISFLSALELGRKIGINIPENIYVIAIEVIINDVFSLNFSKEIQKVFPEIVNSVENIIESIIKKNLLSEVVIN